MLEPRCHVFSVTRRSGSVIRSSGGVCASVDMQRLSGDVACTVGGQEVHRLSDVAGRDQVGRQRLGAYFRRSKGAVAVSNDGDSESYPMGISRWPGADIAASWHRELPGERTESIEIITPVWRIAKVLADDRRRTLATPGIDPSTLDLLSVIRRSGPPYELTTREITHRTMITAGAVSQRVARAEQALVAPAPDQS